MTPKNLDLGEVILKLFEEKDEIRLLDIAEKAGFSPKSAAERRAIQRVLANLVTRKVIQPKGKARARFYILTKKPLVEAVKESEPIFTSKKSVQLFKFLSKPIQTRKPVGYHQDFLRSYQPNKTAYLSASLKKKLRQLGTAENIVRPAGTYARNILNRLLIDLAWNSSRLEGNTYSLLETKRLIELGEDAPGKDATEAQMILNHKNAIEYMIDLADEKKITSHHICSIHALLSENLLGDPSASGRLRKIAVGISATTYLPLDNTHILKELFDIFIEKMNLIEDPFEQSFFSLVHLSYLQAFEDVNKRTARLVANIPFIKQNLRPLSFTEVLQKNYMMSLLGIYEKNDIHLLRDLYVWAYEKSSQRYSALQQTMGEPNIFKLKHRNIIHEIIQNIILKKIAGPQVASKLKELITPLEFSKEEKNQLLQILETEIMSLHDGNIARFKIRPSEFEKWKKLQ